MENRRVNLPDRRPPGIEERWKYEDIVKCVVLVGGFILFFLAMYFSRR
ncbi:MAG: hypothetical protein ABH844_02980 [Candidatus Omnitrophota bacterium]